jgi:hypothetical protein
VHLKTAVETIGVKGHQQDKEQQFHIIKKQAAG